MSREVTTTATLVAALRDDAIDSALSALKAIRDRSEDLIRQITYGAENPGAFMPDAKSIGGMTSEVLALHTALGTLDVILTVATL